MASGDAWNAGWNLGAGYAQEKNSRKEYLWETEQQQKANDLANQRLALQQKYSTTLDANGKPTDASKAIEDALVRNSADLRDFFHPQKNPNAIAKFGHIVTDKLGITKPSPTMTMAFPHPKGLVEAGNINIWNRPTVQNADGSHSTELSISIGTDKGETLIPTIADGKFLTPDGKMPPLVNGKVPPAEDWDKYPAWKALKQNAVQRFRDTGENLGTFANPDDADAYAGILHNRGTAPKGIVKQEQKQEKTKQQNLSEARQIEAAAPLSPAQQAVTDQVAKITAQLAEINKSDLPKEDKEEAVRRVFGLSTKPELKPYRLSSGLIQYYDATRPDLIPEGATAYIPETPAKQEMQDYQDAVAKGFKGTYDDFKALHAKPSVSAVNEGREAYAKSYGFGSFNDIPPALQDAAMNYILRKQAMDKQFTRSTTHTMFKQDVNGNEIPVTVTDYVTPGGNVSLSDPLEEAGYKRAGQAEGTPTPVLGKNLGKKSTGKRSSESGTSGNVRVGQPVFAGRTPSSDLAMKNLQVAQSSYDDVYKAGGGRGDGSLIDPVGSQGIIMAWLRGRVNRVTATEIANVNNLGGAEMKLEGNIVRVVKGTMSPQQYQWFLDSAKRNYDTAQEIAQKYTNPKGNAPQAGALPQGWQ